MAEHSLSELVSEVQLPALTVVKGIPLASSLDVAEKFGKKHRNVLRDICKIRDNCLESFNALNCELVEYTDSKGEKRTLYSPTRDAFSLVVMGFTGKEALVWKVRYIEAFNAMEKALTEPKPLPLTPFPRIKTLPKSYRDQLNDLVLAKLAHEAIRLTTASACGILNFPNYRRRSRRLCVAPQREKSGFSCFCHQSTSRGVGYILAEQRPGVREAPAAFDKPGSVVLPFFVSNPKIIEVHHV